MFHRKKITKEDKDLYDSRYYVYSQKYSGNYWSLEQGYDTPEEAIKAADEWSFVKDVQVKEVLEKIIYKRNKRTCKVPSEG